MQAFFSKVFGRKKEDKQEVTSPTTGPHLLGGRFEAISPNVSPGANFAELEPSPTSPNDKSKESAFGLFRTKSRVPTSPDTKSPITAGSPHLSLDFAESSTGPAQAGAVFDLEADIELLLSEHVIGQRRLNPFEALVLVRACSQAITERGLETLGIMHPHWHSASPDAQRRLISRYIRSLDSQGPSDTSTAALQSHIAFSSPHDVAAVLRWAIRHLQIQGDHLGTDEGWYRAFLDGEAVAGYPPKAFSEKLVPLIPASHLELLLTTLEIFSSLAAHAEANGTSGSKLAKVFGLWLLSSTRVQGKDNWKTFYARWEQTGRMLEHLFLARIRDQNVDQRLPARLRELVRKYPYTHGLSPPTTDLHLLSRPDRTTALFDALFVRIEVELPYNTKQRSKGKIHPRQLITDAFSTVVIEDPAFTQLWSTIVAASGKDQANGTSDSHATLLSGVFADETIRFLSIIPQEGSKAEETKSPTFSPVTPSSPPSRQRSPSASDSPKRKEKEASSSSNSKPEPASPISPLGAHDWAQFSASGFFSGPGLPPLASTLLDNDIEKTTPPEPPLSALARKSSKRRASSSNRKSIDLGRGKSIDIPRAPPAPVTAATATTSGATTPGETPAPTQESTSTTSPSDKLTTQTEIVQIDEAFIDFWSDALLDPISAEWPTFVICKFKSSLAPQLVFEVSGTGEKKIIRWMILEHVTTIQDPPISPTSLATPLSTTDRPSSPTLSLSARKRFSFWTMSRSLSSSSTSSSKSNKEKKTKTVRIGELGELIEEGPSSSTSTKPTTASVPTLSNPKPKPKRKPVIDIPAKSAPATGATSASTSSGGDKFLIKGAVTTAVSPVTAAAVGSGVGVVAAAGAAAGLAAAAGSATTPASPVTPVVVPEVLPVGEEVLVVQEDTPAPAEVQEEVVVPEDVQEEVVAPKEVTEVVTEVVAPEVVEEVQKEVVEEPKAVEEDKPAVEDKIAEEDNPAVEDEIVEEDKVVAEDKPVEDKVVLEEETLVEDKPAEAEIVVVESKPVEAESIVAENEPVEVESVVAENKPVEAREVVVEDKPIDEVNVVVEDKMEVDVEPVEEHEVVQPIAEERVVVEDKAVIEQETPVAEDQPAEEDKVVTEVKPVEEGPAEHAEVAVEDRSPEEDEIVQEDEVIVETKPVEVDKAIVEDDVVEEGNVVAEDKHVEEDKAVADNKPIVENNVIADEKPVEEDEVVVEDEKVMAGDNVVQEDKIVVEDEAVEGDKVVVEDKPVEEERVVVEEEEERIAEEDKPVVVEESKVIGGVPVEEEPSPTPDVAEVAEDQNFASDVTVLEPEVAQDALVVEATQVEVAETTETIEADNGLALEDEPAVAEPAGVISTPTEALEPETHDVAVEVVESNEATAEIQVPEPEPIEVKEEVEVEIAAVPEPSAGQEVVEQDETPVVDPVDVPVSHEESVLVVEEAAPAEVVLSTTSVPVEASEELVPAEELDVPLVLVVSSNVTPEVEEPEMVSAKEDAVTPVQVDEVSSPEELVETAVPDVKEAQEVLEEVEAAEEAEVVEKAGPLTEVEVVEAPKDIETVETIQEDEAPGEGKSIVEDKAVEPEIAAVEPEGVGISESEDKPVVEASPESETSYDATVALEGASDAPDATHEAAVIDNPVVPTQGAREAISVAPETHVDAVASDDVQAPEPNVLEVKEIEVPAVVDEDSVPQEVPVVVAEEVTSVDTLASPPVPVEDVPPVEEPSVSLVAAVEEEPQEVATPSVEEAGLTGTSVPDVDVAGKETAIPEVEAPEEAPIPPVKESVAEGTTPVAAPVAEHNAEDVAPVITPDADEATHSLIAEEPVRPVQHSEVGVEEVSAGIESAATDGIEEVQEEEVGQADNTAKAELVDEVIPPKPVEQMETDEVNVAEAAIATEDAQVDEDAKVFDIGPANDANVVESEAEALKVDKVVDEQEEEVAAEPPQDDASQEETPVPKPVKHDSTNVMDSPELTGEEVRIDAEEVAGVEDVANAIREAVPAAEKEGEVIEEGLEVEEATSADVEEKVEVVDATVPEDNAAPPEGTVSGNGDGIVNDSLEPIVEDVQVPEDVPNVVEEDSKLAEEVNVKDEAQPVEQEPEAGVDLQDVPEEDSKLAEEVAEVADEADDVQPKADIGTDVVEHVETATVEVQLTEEPSVAPVSNNAVVEVEFDDVKEASNVSEQDPVSATAVNVAAVEIEAETAADVEVPEVAPVTEVPIDQAGAVVDSNSKLVEDSPFPDSAPTHPTVKEDTQDVAPPVEAVEVLDPSAPVEEQTSLAEEEVKPVDKETVHETEPVAEYAEVKPAVDVETQPTSKDVKVVEEPSSVTVPEAPIEEEAPADVEVSEDGEVPEKEPQVKEVAVASDAPQGQPTESPKPDVIVEPIDHEEIVVAEANVPGDEAKAIESVQEGGNEAVVLGTDVLAESNLVEPATDDATDHAIQDVQLTVATGDEPTIIAENPDQESVANQELPETANEDVSADNNESVEEVATKTPEIVEQVETVSPVDHSNDGTEETPVLEQNVNDALVTPTEDAGQLENPDDEPKAPAPVEPTPQTPPSEPTFKEDVIPSEESRLSSPVPPGAEVAATVVQDETEMPVVVARSAEVQPQYPVVVDAPEDAAQLEATTSGPTIVDASLPPTDASVEEQTPDCPGAQHLEEAKDDAPLEPQVDANEEPPVQADGTLSTTGIQVIEEDNSPVDAREVSQEDEVQEESVIVDVAGTDAQPPVIVEESKAEPTLQTDMADDTAVGHVVSETKEPETSVVDEQGPSQLDTTPSDESQEGATLDPPANAAEANEDEGEPQEAKEEVVVPAEGLAVAQDDHDAGVAVSIVNPQEPETDGTKEVTDTLHVVETVDEAPAKTEEPEPALAASVDSPIVPVDDSVETSQPPPEVMEQNEATLPEVLAPTITDVIPADEETSANPAAPIDEALEAEAPASTTEVTTLTQDATPSSAPNASVTSDLAVETTLDSPLPLELGAVPPVETDTPADSATQAELTVDPPADPASTEAPEEDPVAAPSNVPEPPVELASDVAESNADASLNTHPPIENPTPVNDEPASADTSPTEEPQLEEAVASPPSPPPSAPAEIVEPVAADPIPEPAPAEALTPEVDAEVVPVTDNDQDVVPPPETKEVEEPTTTPSAPAIHDAPTSTADVSTPSTNVADSGAPVDVSQEEDSSSSTHEDNVVASDTSVPDTDTEVAKPVEVVEVAQPDTINQPEPPAFDSVPADDNSEGHDVDTPAVAAAVVEAPVPPVEPAPATPESTHVAEPSDSTLVDVSLQSEPETKRAIVELAAQEEPPAEVLIPATDASTATEVTAPVVVEEIHEILDPVQSDVEKTIPDALEDPALVPEPTSDAALVDPVDIIQNVDAAQADEALKDTVVDTPSIASEVVAAVLGVDATTDLKSEVVSEVAKVFADVADEKTTVPEASDSPDTKTADDAVEPVT